MVDHVRTRGQAGAQRAAGAALVVDDELLAGVLAHRREQRAREGVGAAAGGEGHDDGHRLGRPVALRPCQRAGQRPTASGGVAAVPRQARQPYTAIAT